MIPEGLDISPTVATPLLCLQMRREEKGLTGPRQNLLAGLTVGVPRDTRTVQKSTDDRQRSITHHAWSWSLDLVATTPSTLPRALFPSSPLSREPGAYPCKSRLEIDQPRGAKPLPCWRVWTFAIGRLSGGTVEVAVAPVGEQKMQSPSQLGQSLREKLPGCAWRRGGILYHV